MTVTSDSFSEVPFDPKVGSPGPSCCSRVIFATIAVAATALAVVAALTIAGHYVSVLSFFPDTLAACGQLEVAIPVLAVSLPLAVLTFFFSCRRLCSSKKKRIPLNISPQISSVEEAGNVTSAPNADYSTKQNSKADDEKPSSVMSGDGSDMPEMSEKDNPLSQPSSVSSSSIAVSEVEEEVVLSEDDSQQLRSYSYKDFSAHEACADKRVGDNYIVSWKHSPQVDLTWIQLLSVEMDETMLRRMNKVPKVHISIDRAEENMTKAFSVIFPLLVSSGIKGFKIIPNHMRENQERLGNPEGKEFVVYFLDDSEEKLEYYQNLFREILKQLKEVGVIAGKPSSGDAPIAGGEGFFYTRAPVNVYDQYLAADFLKKADFTQSESSHISDSLAFRLQLGAEESIEKVETIALESVEDTPNPLLMGVIAKRIQESYFQDLSVLCGSSPALFMLAFGAGVSVQQYDDVADPSLFLRAFHSYTDSVKFFDVMYGSRVKDEFLKEQLARAAKLSAAVQISLGVRESENFGNILPALYHHFLVQWKQREAEGAERALFASKAAEEQFIIEVVKCSLRLRKVQNTSMEPLFCIETSDRALDDFIRAALSQGLDSIVETEEGVPDLLASDLTASMREEGWVMVEMENDPDLITRVSGINVKDEQGEVRSPTPNTMLEYVMGYLPFLKE